MQLHLEMDELNCLANLLLERVRGLSVATITPEQTQQEVRVYNGLLDKVLERDLRFDTDELDQLAAVTAGWKKTLDAEICRQTNSNAKLELEQQRVLLERVMEKVEECCTMF
jgi:hypothetical protein